MFDLMIIRAYRSKLPRGNYIYLNNMKYLILRETFLIVEEKFQANRRKNRLLIRSICTQDCNAAPRKGKCSR